jgi:hypothetical protein
MNFTGGAPKSVLSGEHPGKLVVYTNPEAPGQFRTDGIDGYRGPGPDHGRIPRARTEDIARSFRCSMT